MGTMIEGCQGSILESERSRAEEVRVRYAERSRFDLIASDGGTKTARAATPSNTQIEGFSLYKTVY